MAGGMRETDPVKLAKHCEAFRDGAKKLYDAGNGDMWLFELFHHMNDCAAAFRAQPEYLSGCLHPGSEPSSCQYEGQCLSAACNHNGKTWLRPRMTLEAQDPSLLYPKVET